MPGPRTEGSSLGRREARVSQHLCVGGGLREGPAAWRLGRGGQEPRPGVEAGPRRPGRGGRDLFQELETQNPGGRGAGSWPCGPQVSRDCCWHLLPHSFSPGHGSEGADGGTDGQDYALTLSREENPRSLGWERGMHWELPAARGAESGSEQRAGQGPGQGPAGHTGPERPPRAKGGSPKSAHVLIQ